MAPLARKHLTDAEAKRARHGVLDIRDRDASGASFHHDDPFAVDCAARALCEHLLNRSGHAICVFGARAFATLSPWRAWCRV
jgi:hypothetical protein